MSLGPPGAAHSFAALLTASPVLGDTLRLSLTADWCFSVPHLWHQSHVLRSFFLTVYLSQAPNKAIGYMLLKADTFS